MQENQIKLRTETGEDFDVPVEGSLGLLALGYVGLMLWRDKQQQQLGTETIQQSHNSTQNKATSPSVYSKHK